MGAETAVVGGGSLQVSRLQAVPERFLVALGPEGRAHNVGGGAAPVGILVDAIVDEQVPG